MNPLIRKHTNAAVEARALEIEAFILAQLRIHPTRHLSDFELVEQRLHDGTHRLTVRLRNE